MRTFYQKLFLLFVAGIMSFNMFATASETIAKTILVSSPVSVELVDDEAYPWIVGDGYIESSNNGTAYSKATLEFNLNLENRSVVSFDWMNNSSSNHTLSCFIDEKEYAWATSSSYRTVNLFLEPGEHLVQFVDTIANTTSSRYSRIKNLRICEVAPLENVILASDSEPLTFINDEIYPWAFDGNAVVNTNDYVGYTSSRFSTTFTINEPHLFSFEHLVAGNSYHKLNFLVNGETYTTISSTETDYTKTALLLKAGDYTVEWLDTLSTTTSYKSMLRNVKLSKEWLEVEMTSAGTLGEEVLYLVDVLGDVEMLKISGTLNAADWTTIKNMVNLVALDLSNARFNAVPDYAFDGMSRVSSVVLPEGVGSIGNYAFRGTQLLDIHIPASVKSIGERAFYEIRIEEVSFAENSLLASIGNYAFYRCSNLKEFIMPDGVTSVGNDAFRGCTSLRKMHLSESLMALPSSLCNSCTSLTEVNFPQGLQSIESSCFYGCAMDTVVLPLKLSYLGYYPFEYCNNLKYVELPASVDLSNNYILYGCNNIETIVSRSATPPLVYNDLLAGAKDLSAITLVVPSFAVVNYKLDSYWCQYGNIVAQEDAQDYWKIAGSLSLTNNRRMEGTPDIDLYYGGQLTVGGSTPFEVGTLNLFVNEQEPCRLLSSCEAMSADSVNTHYSVYRDTWYFFTPLHDVELADVKVSNSASYVFRYYNAAARAEVGTGSSWQNVEDTKLYAGQGYIFHCNKECVVTMPGRVESHAYLFNNETKEIALSAHDSENEANRNWNYVGNPYPSYYDIYYMDFQSPITVWEGYTYAAYSTTDDDYVLRPMQSFFVQKPDDAQSIVFHSDGRQLESTVNRVSYEMAYTRSAQSRFVFNLGIGQDSISDRTRVVFNEAKYLDYEISCDAAKFMSMNARVPQIYTIDNTGTRLSINERPQSDGVVRLGVYVAETGAYTIASTRAEGNLVLRDAVTGAQVNLAESDYTFQVDEKGHWENRFTLHVNGLATKVESALTSNVLVVPGKGQIQIANALESTICLYSMEGRLIQTLSSVDGMVDIVVPAGAYIVVVDGVSFKAIVY